MILKNPTEKEISVVYKGDRFTCEAGGSINVKTEVAKWWKSIHGFITIQDGPETNTDEVVENTNDNSGETEGDHKLGDDVSNDGEDEVFDLDSLSRKELDAVAVELGLDSSEYKNKAEVLEAIKTQE